MVFLFCVMELKASIILCFRKHDSIYPTNIYLFIFDNRNTRKKCEIRSKLTIKTPERRQWRRSGVLIFDFEHISQFFVMFLMEHIVSIVSILLKHIVTYWIYFLIVSIFSNFLFLIFLMFQLILGGNIHIFREKCSESSYLVIFNSSFGFLEFICKDF